MLLINGKITYREVDDSILVITPWDNAIHTVENIGKYIFENLIDGKNKESILDNIVNNYDVEKEIAKKDLDEFVSSLIEKEIFIEEV